MESAEKNLMASPKKERIFIKYIYFVLPMLVVAIVFTGTVLSWTNYIYFRDSIEQDYRNILKSATGEIKLYVINSQRALQSMARVMWAAKLDRWHQKMALVALLQAHLQFATLELKSVDGETLATTALEPGTPVAEDHRLQRRAKRNVSGISDVRFDDNNIPYILMSVPIRRMGKVTEVLWGKLNLKSMWERLEGIKIGKSGYIYLLNSAGRFVAHPDMAVVVRNPQMLEPVLVQKIKRSTAPVKWTRTDNGLKLYSLAIHIPELDWIVVLNQNLFEIYQFLFYNIAWAIVLTLAICLAAIWLGWMRTHKITEPIRTLHDQVRTIGKGDLTKRVEVTTGDELGDLGRAFNEMAESLLAHVLREVQTAQKLAHSKNLAVLGMTSSKVTHEVGNLLNNVGLTLSTFKEEPLSDKGQKALKLLEKESVRVKSFIHDYLQFAKPPELNLRQSNLKLIVQEAMVMHRPQADAKSIRLEVVWPDELPAIPADPKFVYQAFNNLIKNSIQAMSEPGEIRIQGTNSGERLRIRIRDSGPGIPIEMQEKIFQPFFTTKGGNGTGLGLAVTQTIIEAHRGMIKCISNPGEGTCFEISLPIA